MTAGIPLPLVRFNQWFQVITVLLALGTGQIWILAIPLLIGLISLVTGINLLFLSVRPLLKKPASAYPLEDPAQQRFNQGIAVGCLGGSIITFGLGWTGIGTALAILVAVAALIAILGFCVGCFIRMQLLRWKRSRS
jgi:hypothetical protein